VALGPARANTTPMWRPVIARSIRHWVCPVFKSGSGSTDHASLQHLQDLHLRDVTLAHPGPGVTREKHIRAISSQVPYQRLPLVFCGLAGHKNYRLFITTPKPDGVKAIRLERPMDQPSMAPGRGQGLEASRLAPKQT